MVPDNLKGKMRRAENENGADVLKINCMVNEEHRPAMNNKAAITVVQRL
jgi:hypothetical protein